MIKKRTNADIKKILVEADSDPWIVKLDYRDGQSATWTIEVRDHKDDLMQILAESIVYQLRGHSGDWWGRPKI